MVVGIHRRPMNRALQGQMPVPKKPRNMFGNGQSIWGGMPDYLTGIQSEPLGEPMDEFGTMFAELNAQAAQPKPQQGLMAQPEAQKPSPVQGLMAQQFQKPEMTWSDKLGMFSAALRDYDGTMGDDNLMQVQGQYDQRVQQGQADFEAQRQAKILEAAAMGDPTALAMLDPIGARNFNYGMQRDQIGDDRYQDQTDYSRGRDETEDQYRERVYQRGIVENDRDFSAREAARAAETTPRNIWQSAGDGYIFNQSTGESRSASGGSMAGGGPAPSMDGLSEAFQQTPFSKLPVYDADGAQQVQGFTWRGAAGDGGVEDRRGLMEPNREGNARGDKKLDETVAKDLAAWKTGNRTTAFTNLQRLQSVITDLESGANLSGPVTGALPGWAQAAVNPKALATKQAVDSVIQQSLKAILGGQFTEKEAQGMLERAYNPRLSEAENAKNLKLIYNDLVGRSTTMEMMSAYQDQYGTVQGFQSPTEGVQDFGKKADGSVVPDGAIKALQANPALRSQFEAKYGPGSASQYLDGQGAN